MLEPALVAGASGLLVVVCLAVFGPIVLPTDPHEVDLGRRLAPPHRGHWLGCDGLGRDVLARLVHGARRSLGVGFLVVAVSASTGIFLGTLAGAVGGWIDRCVVRIVDVLLAFPGLLLAIALGAVLGPGLGGTIVALGVVGWTGYARLARAEAASLAGRDFAEAARALGASPLRIVVRHLLPVAAPVLLVQTTFALSNAILADASLSFLGLGAAPPTPTWGGMLDEGRQLMLPAPHVLLAPAVALTGTVVALQLLGDGLRDRFEAAARPTSP